VDQGKQTTKQNKNKKNITNRNDPVREISCLADLHGPQDRQVDVSTIEKVASLKAGRGGKEKRKK